MIESTPESVGKGLLVGIVTGVILTLAFLYLSDKFTPESNQSSDQTTLDTEWKLRVDTLEGRLPSQSHAMMDVAYHFSNLWFAGTEGNWPLAAFYLAETRSHLHWAVRIIPVRKDLDGKPVDLKTLLEGVETGVLLPLEGTIKTQDNNLFQEGYRKALEGCYSCHVASGKLYLTLKVPEAAPEKIIDFTPGVGTTN